MAKISAGVLLVRSRPGGPQFLLVHPGGPFFARRDAGAWTIPKGLVEQGEDELTTALRELTEETGAAPPEGEPVDPGRVVQKGGKVVRARALAGDFDPATLESNEFELEWPPRSGKRASFPEVDRAEWFDEAEAKRRINPARAALIDRAVKAIANSSLLPSTPTCGSPRE